MLENEINSMMDLDHPHICNLYEYFIDGEDVYLILELLEGKDLFDRMLEVFSDHKRDPPNRFGEYEAGVLLRHMLKAVFCCHSANIVHRDIKPENFMFARKDDPNSDLKMIDLGLALRGGPERMTEATGTVGYMAPEMIMGKGYSRNCDVWSLGCICYIMLTGEPLFTLTDDSRAKMQIQNKTHVKK